MKISKKQLEQIIKEELETVKEHRAGDLARYEMLVDELIEFLDSLEYGAETANIRVKTLLDAIRGLIRKYKRQIKRSTPGG